MLEIKKQLATIEEDFKSVHELECTIEAVRNGYTDYYDLNEQELSEEKDSKWTGFILDVLEMYSHMINSIQNDQRPPYNHTIDDVKFPGFNGNNEDEEKRFVEFFIIKLSRYAEIEDINKGDYNSQTETSAAYRRMLDKYNDLGKPVLLNDDEISELLNAYYLK